MGAAMAWHTQPAGVDEQSMYERASQEPGRSSRLCGKAGWTEHCSKVRAPRRPMNSARRAKQELFKQALFNRCGPGEETKAGVTGARKSERLIVPMKLGNFAHEDPAEGRMSPCVGIFGGKDEGDIELREHLNATTENS